MIVHTTVGTLIGKQNFPLLKLKILLCVKNSLDINYFCDVLSKLMVNTSYYFEDLYSMFCEICRNFTILYIDT